MTIRKRLLSGYLFMMALMLIGFSVATYFVTRWRLTEEIDADLDGRIDQFVKFMNESGDEIELEVRRADQEHDFFWRITLPDGTQVEHSKAYAEVATVPPPLGDVATRGATSLWSNFTPNHTHMRFARRSIEFHGGPHKLKIVTFTFNDKNQLLSRNTRFVPGVTALVIDAGTTLDSRDQALDSLMLILLVAVPSMLLLTALGGFVLVSRALDPVVAITRAAAGVGPGNLDARVPGGPARDEIGRLADVINRMLDRIAEGFSRERQFTGDASHELRTPLTVLRGDIEVSLRKTRSQEEYRQVLLRALDEAGRMERVVTGLLFLARADAGRIRLDTEPIDLAALLTKVTNAVRRLPGAPEIRVARLPAEAVHVHGSLNLLETLFTNLLENAIKHGTPPIVLEVSDVPAQPPGSAAAFASARTSRSARQSSAGDTGHRTRATDFAAPNESVDPIDSAGLANRSDAAGPSNPLGSWTVSVLNGGPPIPADELPHLFDRFYRTDKARSRSTGGVGLGLSICKWITAAHQGSIAVRNEPAGGIRFTVTLPKSRATQSAMPSPVYEPPPHTTATPAATPAATLAARPSQPHDITKPA
ncbi:MAG: sensor histidine kinase [Planctomycetota bacterium]